MLWGITEEFEQVRSFDIYRGRFFSDFEINSGRNFCVIGYTLAEELFRGMDPLGREIKLQGKEATIIGVFTREGKSFLGGGSMDKVVHDPGKVHGGHG